MRKRHARGKGARAASRDAKDDRSQGRLIEGVGAVPVPTGTRPGVTSPGRSGHTSLSRFARRTGVNVSGSVNELTDGTLCSVDAAMRGGMAPYWESRFRRVCL